MTSTLPQRSTASPWKSMTLTWRHAWKALDWVKWQFSSVLLVSDSMALLTLLVRPQVSWTLYALCPSCLRILYNFVDEELFLLHESCQATGRCNCVVFRKLLQARGHDLRAVRYVQYRDLQVCCLWLFFGISGC